MATFNLVSFILAFGLSSNIVAAQDNLQDILKGQYKSRPDIVAPVWNISIHDEALTTPGYIFVAPFGTELPIIDIQPAPYIYDSSGELVWTGNGLIGGVYSTDFHVCDYNGEGNHLCFYNGEVGNGYGRGHGVILDSSYRTVAEVHTGNGRAAGDLHEFNVLAGGKTALVSVYPPVPYDLTDYGVGGTQGWIMDGIVQEIDIESGEVLFEWRALDHVDPSECYVAPSSSRNAGDGLTPLTAWEYFHLNAIDKDPAGNYLISSRYCCTIFNVSSTGDINWRLNGYEPALSNYTLEDFDFAFQHDVRYQSQTENTTIISLFDNGSDGDLANANQSRGYIISLDNIDHTATLLHAYPAPQDGGLLTTAQGNVELMSNGNIWMGWGVNPYVSEYTEDGDALYYASFSGLAGAFSYRAYKSNFTATPVDVPAVYAYARDSSAPTTLWTSWNGCTECAAWKFWYSSGGNGAFTATDLVTKTGFETNVTIGEGISSVYSEAFDAQGNSLGKSMVESPFVPGPKLAIFCGKYECLFTGVLGNITDL